MRLKKLSFFVFAILVNNIYGTEINSKTDEVTIDLNTNTLVAKDGIVFKSGNMSGIFHNLEKNDATDTFKFSNQATVNIEQNSGNIKIETEKGTLDETNKIGEFYNNFAYINVAKMTGAEAPNDKIYFGSPYIKYETDKVYVKDGWITTDFSIVNNPEDPKKAGYHLLAKDIIIEPEKQLTLKDTTLFIGKRDVLPFNLPWFRANIRKGSKVPLFPTIKSSKEDGFEVMWGVLYGNRNDKFVGGIAPKFADKTGLFIGRWENWYKSDNYGNTRLNIDDLLLFSKAKKPTSSEEQGEYEKKKRKYKVTFIQDYSGDNGYFDFTAINATRSMIGSLNDAMDKFEDNKLYKTHNIDRLKYDKNIGFYTLDTDLKNIGEDKDLSLKSKVNMVTDKKAYGLMVYEDIKDVGDNVTDHDLYTNIDLKKDNSKLKLNLKYDYLYDMDPGSTYSDLMSRNEKYTANFLLKDSGIGFDYVKRNGNDYRPLEFWDRDIKSNLTHKNVLGIAMNYTPKTVEKYTKNDYEDAKIYLGNYNLFSDYIFSPTLSLNKSEKNLSLVQDEFRVNNLGKGRLAEYNRFDDNVYTNFSERRADFSLKNPTEEYKIGFGKTNNEIWDREGLFDGKVRKYKNKSKFYDLGVSKNFIFSEDSNIKLGAKFRQDKYDNSNDKTNLLNLTFENGQTIYSNLTSKLSNKFGVEFQKYSFSGNKAREEQRLIEKNDFFKVDNTISYEMSKYKTDYNIVYERDENPYGKKNKSREYIANKVSVNLDEDRKLSFNYSEDKKFTSRTVSENNLNYLTTKKYGFSIDGKKHGVSFQNTSLKYRVEDFANTPNALEKINQNEFGYSYKFDNSKLSLLYTEGKDNVTVQGIEKITKRNREYKAEYKINGDIEQNMYASLTQYRYGKRTMEENIRNTDVYKLGYEYKDNRLEKEDLLKYATLEYQKPSQEITTEDISKIKTILERKQDLRKEFNLTRIQDETFALGDSKRSVKAYVTLEKNNYRYSQTGNLGQSFSKLEGGIDYSQNRVGVGYKFKEEADWSKKSGRYDWQKKNREHEVSVYAKIGKPSQGWKVKTYAKFYDNLTDNDRGKKRSLDGLGVEIAKEMGYYEWGVSYENKYSPSSKNYEWRAGVHFTLLTFPNDSIAGVGVKSTRKNQIRPDGYLLDRPSPLNDGSSTR